MIKLEIVSANRLADGRVVYLAHGDKWSECIIDGRCARNTEESATLLAEAERAVKDGVVVEPYLVEMTNDGGAFAPVHYRELIRQRGPTQSAAHKHTPHTRV